MADDKVDATCTSSGLTSGAHCVVCNEVIIAQNEIPQLAHSYSAWNVREQASCKEFGIEYRICSGCNKEETKSIEILPHATAIWVIEEEATCTESGIKAKKCSACLTTLETQTIPETGHSWEDATCTAPETCSSCKATRGSTLEHNWIEETCATPQFCADCGKIGNSEKAHSFSDYKCIVCGIENIITVTKSSDEEMFYAFSNSRCKIKFSNFKAYYLEIKDDDDNIVDSISLSDEMCVSLSNGTYIVTLTYYNSYKTVMQNIRQPDGSYGYQYVTKGDGTMYSLIFGIIINDSIVDTSVHNWYVKNYVPATCTKTGYLALACTTCSSISERIVPLAHIDTNTDHSCDECGANMGLHSDKTNDGDHLCEYCKATASSCADSDKNHICNECGANVGTHNDKSNDGDHKCDYGCGEILTSCNDADKDHNCDDCGINMGSHSDKENDGDHLCEYCKKAVSSCADSDKNHICNECGANVGTHNDKSNDGDHKCDYGCGEILTSCNDADKDHNCDDCGINMGSHSDKENDGDHLCEYCEMVASDCIDNNLDHDCDECGKYIHNYLDNTCTLCGLYCNSKKVTFGSYPQSEVVDSDLKTILNSKAGPLPSNSNSEAWTSYGYYINGSVSNFMWYIDIYQEGERYRGVYFTSYRPYDPEYTSSPSNTRQDDNGYVISTVYWFKYEPISWTILSEDITNETALIFCDMIIDAQSFDYDGLYSNNYADSTVKKWLCETFYNTAFNNLQKQMIITDIFLLSDGDVTNRVYGFSSSLVADSSRQKKPSDYAKAQGAGESWLLSSPDDYNSYSVCVVDSTGDINSDGYGFCAAYTIFGIVPAVKIRL